MPANTTNGLPYPLPTDRLADGAVAIQNLAQAADDKLLVPWTLFPMLWIGATTNPNKGSTGTCDLRYLRRGHTVDFAFRLNVAGSGISLGGGNYSFQTLPFPVVDFDRYSFAAITTGPNRQYICKLTSAMNMTLYKTGASSAYSATDAASDGWGNGTTVSISGSYETP